MQLLSFLRSGTSKGFPLFSCPDKNKVNFIPRGSAFCPVKLLCSSLFSPVSPVGPGLHSSSSSLGPQLASVLPAAPVAAFSAFASGSGEPSGDATSHSSTDGQTSDGDVGRDGAAPVLLTS